MYSLVIELGKSCSAETFWLACMSDGYVPLLDRESQRGCHDWWQEPNSPGSDTASSKLHLFKEDESRKGTKPSLLEFSCGRMAGMDLAVHIQS